MNLDERLEMLRKFEERLEKQVTITKEKENLMKTSASAEFCPICYAAAIDTQFVPCGHNSCHTCIKRHLLNSNKCFYCNAPIEKIEHLE